jgi:hypothetical protein
MGGPLNNPNIGSLRKPLSATGGSCLAEFKKDLLSHSHLVSNYVVKGQLLWSCCFNTYIFTKCVCHTSCILLACKVIGILQVRAAGDDTAKGGLFRQCGQKYFSICLSA